MAGRGKSEEIAVVTEGRRRNPFVTWLIVIILLLIIAHVAFWFIGKSPWALQQTEKMLEDRTGMELVIGRTYFVPYELVVEDIDSYEVDPGEPSSIHVDELRLGLTAGMMKSVEIRGAKVRLKHDEDGRWNPGFLARIGDFTDTTQIADLTEDFRDHYILDIRNSSIEWLGLDSRPFAAVDDMDFRLVPVKLDGDRKLYHCRITAERIQTGPGPGRSSVKEEWLITQGNGMLDMGDSVERSRASGGDVPVAGPGDGGQIEFVGTRTIGEEN